MVRQKKLEHPGAPPSFHFKLGSFYRSALSRQVRDVIIIRRRGGAWRILNSKAEFNCCYIPRIVREEEEESIRKQRLELEQSDREERNKVLEQMDLAWSDRRSRELELAAKKRERLEDALEGERKPKRSRKRKYTPPLQWEEEDGKVH